MATHAKTAVVRDATQAFKSYISTSTHTYPPDVQLKGEIISGTWEKVSGLVSFSIPAHLVEAFEGHHHFLNGNFKAE